MNKVINYFIALCGIIFGLTGMLSFIIYNSDYSKYCKYNLHYYILFSGLLYLLVGLSIGVIQIGASLNERKFSIIIALNEYPTINILYILFICSLLLWGFIELVRNTCFAKHDLFNVGIVMFVIQLVQIIFQICMTHKSLIDTIDKIKECKINNNGNEAKHITNNESIWKIDI